MWGQEFVVGGGGGQAVEGPSQQWAPAQCLQMDYIEAHCGVIFLGGGRFQNGNGKMMVKVVVMVMVIVMVWCTVRLAQTACPLWTHVVRLF